MKCLDSYPPIIRPLNDQIRYLRQERIETHPAPPQISVWKSLRWAEDGGPGAPHGSSTGMVSGRLM